MKVLMVFKVLDSRSCSSGLKSDEFQRCSWGGNVLPKESGKRKRSAEVQGALVEWKDKATKAWHKLNVQKSLSLHPHHLHQSQDLQTAWALSAMGVTPLGCQRASWSPGLLEGKFYGSLFPCMVICIGNSSGLMHKLLKILSTLIYYIGINM